jgi:phospholipid-translocating ATPase
LDLLEENLEFLGITGVEDKLQGIIYWKPLKDEVLSTIESLRFGGIKIWMLTGDKMETAKVII